MGRVFALALAILLAVFVTKQSDACENITLADRPEYKAMREAEEALDEGDVVRARKIASAVNLPSRSSIAI